MNKTSAIIAVKTYGRIEAMAQAEEQARRQIEPGAVAVSASKGSTSKADRRAIERNASLQPWMVEVEYDLKAAAVRLAAEWEHEPVAVCHHLAAIRA